MAMRVVAKVPATSGRTPKLGGLKSGDHFVPNRKSWIGTARRKTIVSSTSAKMIPIVVSSEISAARSRTPLMTDSPQRRRAARRRGASGRPLRPTAVVAASNYPPSAAFALAAWPASIATICEASAMAW